MAEQVLSTQCCIAGGGPAGMMLGVLLARAGIDTIVLEKHADFLRDFRGDTIHPSTLEVLGELGWLEAFLRLPHQEVHAIGVSVAGNFAPVADFSHLPTRCRFVAFLPQWDFLDFLAQRGGEFHAFNLRRSTEALDLLRDEGRVTGLRARSPDGPITIRADLVVAADGRHSRLRQASGLPRRELGAPMDVLWLRLPRRPEDPSAALGHVVSGAMVVLLDRGDYWQCAVIIPKGGFEALQAQGLDPFRQRMVKAVPWLADRVAAIGNWDMVSLLAVQVDRLEQWCQPGFLCIGDAAHAMSPIGGVGINLAIQDAVAAARLLAPALRHGPPDLATLMRVQQRRDWPTRATQRMQVLAQDRIIAPILAGGGGGMPLILRLLRRFPPLRRIPARLLGIGFRPEHLEQ